MASSHPERRRSSTVLPPSPTSSLPDEDCDDLCSALLTSLTLKKKTPKYRYSWKRDSLDSRDRKYEIGDKLRSFRLPPRVDLRHQHKEIYDQGYLGSCTANALAYAIDFCLVKNYKSPLLPSRLFLYYNERVIEGTVDQDAGAELRSGIKASCKIGNCPETCWPYEVEEFRTRPPNVCYVMASKNLLKAYFRIDNTKLNLLKTCLADGYTFVCGISVYESFESDQVASTGIVPTPQSNHEELLGGHAVLCVGYDDDRKVFIMRNSWGLEWGDRGHFYIGYDYLTNADLAADFWTLRLVQ